MRRREKYLFTGAGVGVVGSILYDIWRQRKLKAAQGDTLTLGNYNWNQTAKLILRNGAMYPSGEPPA